MSEDLFGTILFKKKLQHNYFKVDLNVVTKIKMFSWHIYQYSIIILQNINRNKDTAFQLFKNKTIGKHL